MLDQQQRERPREQDAPWLPKNEGPLAGPRTPDIQKPDTSRLLKKMRAVDNNQSKKYRQRSGE